MNLQYDGLKVVHADPPIIEIDNFFPHALCDFFVEKAQESGIQVSSRTFSPLTNAKRTSTTWYLPYKDTAEFLMRAYDLTGMPINNFEEIQVVRYEMGQQFTWHYDAIPPSMLTDNSGKQRIATLLVYLNDVSQGGGATCFKDLDIQVQPKKGKALLFFPAFADGTPDDRTLHCGQITMDTKWIAQVWIHELQYSPSEHVGGAVGHEEAIAAVEALRSKVRLELEQL